jgi:hypothetical protein
MKRKLGGNVAIAGIAGKIGREAAFCRTFSRIQIALI